MSDVLMTINKLGLNNVILVLSAIACTVSFFVLFSGYQKNKRLNRKLARLEHDLRVANGSAIGMGQQLIEMEKRLGQQNPSTLAPVIVKQSSTPSKNQYTPSQKEKTYSAQQTIPQQTTAQEPLANQEDSIYDQARQSLAQGLEVGEVAKQCGLSFAEVSLLKSLIKSATVSH